MRDPVIKTYKVEGEGVFPLQMLSTDKSWPAAHQDAADIEGTTRRTLTLATMAIYSPSRSIWARTGWTVVD